jgi:hypothetical protein
MVHGLGSLLESWSYYVEGDLAKMLKIDPHTVEKLQGFAPSVSAKDKKVVKGLVKSGQVFSNFTTSERKAVWKRLKRRKDIIPSLHTFFQDMWYLEACANCMKRLVNPCQRYPSVKSAFLGVFKLVPNNGRCLIQTSETNFRHQGGSQTNRAELGYRQLWLYAMRHYPQIPREQSGDDLVAKPGHEKADEMILHDMAVLAQRLGFDSPHIQNLIQQSPDRQMARDILLKARKPDRYQYPEDIFESLVTRICDCFSEAVSLDHPTSPEPALAREIKLKRYGLPHRNAQRQDSRLLFLDELHANNVPLDTKVTTFFVRRCFYFAFFGQLPEALPLSPAQTSPPSSDGSLPHSPIFVPDDRLLVPASSVVSRTQRRREGRIDGQSRRDVAPQNRRRRKQEAKERRRQERRRRQELRRSRPPHDRSPTMRNIDDHDMEDIHGPLVVLPERPECTEGERTSMEVNSPVIPSNADQNDRDEMEESDGFNSDSERASTATHVQFGEESEAAPDRAGRALNGVVEAQPAAEAPRDLEMELQRELDRLQRDAEERVKDAEQGNREAESVTTERAISVRRSVTEVDDALEEGTVHLATARSNDRVEPRQELLQEVLVEKAERQDVGSIASTDSSDTLSQALNAKAMTNKDKRHGGIEKWAPYDATKDGNHTADRGQRVTRVDFTELELNSNQLSASNVLQPSNKDHTENEPIHPEGRVVESEGLDRSEVLPTAFVEHTVPDIVIHTIAEQADTPTAPFEPEVVESPQNPSDEGRVPAAADLAMVDAPSQLLKASSMKSAQIKGKGQKVDPKWVPYDQTRRDIQERAARQTPGRGRQGRQHTRPVTQVTFSGMELAPSQQPPETEASTEHGPLHPEATIPGHSRTSNDLHVPTVAQEQLAFGELQGQVAGTVDYPARRPLKMETSNLPGVKTGKEPRPREHRRRVSRPLGIRAAKMYGKQVERGIGRASLSGKHRLSLSTVTHRELPPSTEDAAQIPTANTISDQGTSEVHQPPRTHEQHISETWDKRQRRISRPLGIKKTREKARAQDRKNSNPQARQNRVPVTEPSDPVPHQDGQESRAEKVVTRINFEDWAKSMVQVEHEASSTPTPEPPSTTELRAETASGEQPTTVMAESSQVATARSAREFLKPPVQEVRTAPSEPNPISQAVTITFRARGDDGRWKTVHALQVNPSDPSDVERVARKDARNRNATFYDKNLRKLTPAQCFEAAIEDETNTIFMKFDGELVMDEETMASIMRDIEL